MEASLNRWFRRALCAALLGVLAQLCAAQNTPAVALDTSETLFTVLTAVNLCGYDAELSISDPLRQQVRSEVAKIVQTSAEAREASKAMCQFYDEHQQPDPSRSLAQFISLALYLNPPPALTVKGKDSDVPPDAAYVLGFLPLLQRFATLAGLHTVWERHSAGYDALADRYHQPLAKMTFDTEVYLRFPSAGYLGHEFVVYLEPMGAPGQTNARNYGPQYFVVISPGTSSSLKVQQIRHTYLHYLLDPLAMKYPTAVKRLSPILDAVKTAPMDESFKNDATLLVTECLIRAIEVHTKSSDVTVEDSVAQGFVLTQYFYDALTQFEKEPTGLRNAYAEMLGAIDVSREEKKAMLIQFANKADPELLHLSRPMEGKLLTTAEQRLTAGDVETAQKLAQQALEEKSEDAGRALFILAQVATMNKDINGARDYFERALGVAQEPNVVAWSHIYLGRIFDLQEDREAALDQYRAALTAGAALPEAKKAAERGIEQPYEPQRRSQ